MSRNTETAEEEEANATDSESLLLYHLIGWGISAIVLISVIYAVLVTPPVGSLPHDWFGPLGLGGQIGVWLSPVSRTALRAVIGLTVLCIVVTGVIKLGMRLKSRVGDE
ncbi:hypothetical protein [Natranaeroarchaeum sulfidigenes]|uniref:Uncharacterized protein n=1 Tax=Natranaeroarchaeum sulfidigenes TaxID=2784880 RepID=A0A897MUP1_9EURY|nr:hypothetical protein [Natranaeroarchaeum sulfidigenes]QSG02669.1 hypothetical protein AArcS_1456 [Natranaeroarchaeum sulfidigenes]